MRLVKGLLGIGLVLLLGGWFLTIRSKPVVILAEDNITVNPLHPVNKFVVDSSVTDLPTAFARAGIEFYPQNKVTTFPDISLGLGSKITVEQALPVTIIDGKKKQIFRTWSTTIGEVLDENHIEIGEEDKLSLARSTQLSPETTLTINRVSRTNLKETEKIAYQTTRRENASMWRGQEKVVTAGVDGLREKTWELIREDGELISKTLIKNIVTTPAVTKIVEFGTKLKIGETYHGKATYYENNLGTKVATDKFKRGVELRVTNLNNGKSIIVRNDGCICGATGVLIDLNPTYFQQLGGTLGQGVLQNIRVEEILP